MNRSIEEIVNEFGASILKICVGYSQSYDDAKDLYQDVLVNVWKGLQSFRNDASVKTWIYRICINTCLLKQRKKRIRTVSFDPKIHDQKSVDTTNGSNEKLARLTELIRQLPEKDKSIILLYLDGLSYQEISNVIGLSVSNTGVKINRIKKNLIKKIRNE